MVLKNMMIKTIIEAMTHFIIINTTKILSMIMMMIMA